MTECFKDRINAALTRASKSCEGKSVAELAEMTQKALLLAQERAVALERIGEVERTSNLKEILRELKED